MSPRNTWEGILKKITLFQRLRDTKQPIYITIGKALERISEGESYDLITKIRNERDHKKRAILKEGLPSICWSGTFRTRKDSDLLQHSGLVVLDFDKVGEPEYLKEELATDKYCFAAWISPSGNGVKALVKIPSVAEDHRLHYLSLLDYYDYAEKDESNVNESRVCYESYDPDLYVNWNSEVYTEKKEPQTPPQYKYNERRPENAINEPEKIYTILKVWMDREDNYEPGNRHNFYVKFAFNLCEFGVSLEDSMEWLFRDYPHENEKGAKDAIKSGYESRIEKQGTKYFEDRSVKRKYLTFWTVEETKDSTKVNFQRTKFIQWLQSQGISRYRISDGHWIIVLVRDQVAREIFRPDIKHIAFEYVNGLPNEFDGITKPILLEVLARGVNSFFSAEFLDLLIEIPITWNRDTESEAYFYYQNTVVCAGARGYYTMNYSDLPGVIWESQIINRAFVKTDDYKNDFRTFCNNVCGNDSQRYESLKSIIGYLLSDHKDPKEFPVVVLMDEQISEHPEGGTGKGLFNKGVRALKGGVIIDGKNWSLDKSFPWQRINLDTKFIVFEDVAKNFQFERFFSVTGEGMTVEKKGQQSFFISFEDCAKMAITTNYTITGLGNSNRRRLVEIEFAQCYNKDNTPFKDFGKLLFDDWDLEEWNSFDNYMIGCCVYYIKNKKESEFGYGIVPPVDINISEKKLVASTSPELVEWADSEIMAGRRYDKKKDLFHYFVQQNEKQFGRLTPRTFNKWLKIWAEYRNYSVEESKSGNDFYYTFQTIGAENVKSEENFEFPF